MKACDFGENLRRLSLDFVVCRLLSVSRRQRSKQLRQGGGGGVCLLRHLTPDLLPVLPAVPGPECPFG